MKVAGLLQVSKVLRISVRVECRRVKRPVHLGINAGGEKIERILERVLMQA